MINKNEEEQLKTAIPLPDMTVEKRVSNKAWGIPPPEEKRALQMQESIILNEAAKVGGWSVEVEAILHHYFDHGVDISESVEAVTGFKSWRDLSIFVQDDMCSEFFNMALKYCLREGQKHKVEKGFIDGTGIGYLKSYITKLKPALERCFDAKYFYKMKRPLEYIRDEFGMDLSVVANHIHPGHWSYPAGHGTKFLVAVEVLNDVFHLDAICYRTLLTAACAGAMGRTGNLIHDPQDNLAGGHLTSLKEFK